MKKMSNNRIDKNILKSIINNSIDKESSINFKKWNYILMEKIWIKMINKQ